MDVIPVPQYGAAMPASGEEPLLTIGEMAKACKITVRALRYYEEMDLISPIMRTQGRYRLYHVRTLKRIQAIQALQNLGYSLEEILEALGPSSVVANICTKKSRLTKTLTTLENQKQCVEDRIHTLQLLKGELDERYQTIQTFCEPCVNQSPTEDCRDSCEHRGVHLD
jgi:DNA-binding transcriptional MerR regulator